MLQLIPDQFVTDALLCAMRAAGWTIKSPLFVNGITIFPAIKRA